MIRVRIKRLGRPARGVDRIYRAGVEIWKGISMRRPMGLARRHPETLPREATRGVGITAFMEEFARDGRI